MSFNKQTVADIPIANKTVLVSVDFNVPLKDDQSGNAQVDDDYRIVMALPTIKYLIEQNCRIALISHLGRPKGHVDFKLSLRPVAKRLSELLGQEVSFVANCVGDQVIQALKQLEPANVILLENTRFHAEEEENDKAFSVRLATGFDYFVQNAFGNAHREHASTVGVNSLLPSVSGYLVEKEVSTIQKAIADPKKPLVSIIGGAKIATKIDLMDKFSTIADSLVIGGAMANTFLVAMGHNIGKSLFDETELGHARTLIERSAAAETELFFPNIDVGVAKEIDNSAKRQDKDLYKISDDDIILDFGPKSLKKILDVIDKAGTVLWNGPIGMTELDAFANGTKQLAEHLIDHHTDTIVGGGDTAGFIHEHGMVEGFTHVSTGGGASLQVMAGKKLPGVEALLDK